MKTVNEHKEKKKINSVFLLMGVVVFSVLGMCFLQGQLQDNGAVVVVTVDGQEWYKGSLFLEKEFSIDGNNTLLIKDGMADMISADCPDQVCVKHAPVYKAGESIICLPNKVVVMVQALNGNEKSSEDKVDVIVR